MFNHSEEKIEFRKTVEQLWKRHSEEIYTLCEQKCATAEDARDLFQTVALKFCENLQNLMDRADIMPWIITVVKNSYLDEALERNRMKTMTSICEDTPEYMPFSEENAAFYSRPATVEQKMFLFKTLGLLNPLERMLLEMRYLGGFSVHELSCILGLSENAVRKRRLHAFKKLRRFYRENDILTKIAE